MEHQNSWLTGMQKARTKRKTEVWYLAFTVLEIEAKSGAKRLKRLAAFFKFDFSLAYCRSQEGYSRFSKDGGNGALFDCVKGVNDASLKSCH